MSRPRAGLGWLVVLLVLVGVAGFAWWVVKYGLEPVPEASASPSGAASAPALEAANGYWCTSDAEVPCVTVALPTVTYDGDDADPIYVFPEDADTEADPATLDYDVEANLGECWQATVGSQGGPADAAFVFCPEGAESGDEDLDASDASLDRLWITQDTGAEPYVRAEPN